MEHSNGTLTLILFYALANQVLNYKVYVPLEISTGTQLCLLKFTSAVPRFNKVLKSIPLPSQSQSRDFCLGKLFLFCNCLINMLSKFQKRSLLIN